MTVTELIDNLKACDPHLSVWLMPTDDYDTVHSVDVCDFPSGAHVELSS